MATKPETTFTGSVHKHLPPMDELYRMKNSNQYNAGIADVWYSGNRDLWVEYKFITLPKRPETPIHISGKSALLSPLQTEWLTARHHEGRNVAVIVGCKEGGVIFPGVSWNGYLSTEWFRKQIISRADLARRIQELVA